jgi:FAD-NAD(P)-binding
MPDRPAMVVAIIGAGPTASSLLERLSANAAELLNGRRLIVHLIDPHRAGTGRVWRADLDRRLWMNSMAEDVTLFTDDSVRCEGPIRPGPSLYEWAQTVDDETLGSLACAAVAREIRSLTGMTFPTRRVQSVYLNWFHRRVLSSLPEGVSVVLHGNTAVDVVDFDDGTQEILLDNGDVVVVDTVIFALGHLDAYPDEASAKLTEFAVENGLVHIPSGHTAELDLSVIPPRAEVIVLGFGQAFTDLLVLLTEARGGRFRRASDGQLTYEPSGSEPIVYVGSRRGVPYRSKISYRLRAAPADLPRFLDDGGIARLLEGDAPLDFRRHIFPTLAKEIGWSYYHELFLAHPDRTTASWQEFSDLYAQSPPGVDLDALIAAHVPDPADRFQVGSLDRPLADVRFDSRRALHDHVSRHVADDIARRTNPSYSADLGAFNAMLASFVPLGVIAASDRLKARSRVDDLGAWWFSFFMYFASGPPPARLEQLLALADAGLVHFLGAQARVGADADRRAFVATSTSHPDSVVTDYVIDARVSSPSLSRTKSELLRRLHHRGEIVEEVVSDDAGWVRNTGKVMIIGPDLRILTAEGVGHPRRHALGVFTSRPASGAFARPHTNAPAFRQNDTVARSVLQALVEADTRCAVEAPSSPMHSRLGA